MNRRRRPGGGMTGGDMTGGVVVASMVWMGLWLVTHLLTALSKTPFKKVLHMK